MWLGVDPLAYTNPYVSPYVYCLSNPINLIDPDGRKEYSYSEATKNWDKFDTQNDEIKLDAICIKGTPIQYDQPYGQTITGGMGDGVQTTSKYKGPSIDASLFSYPLGSTANSFGEFFYNIILKSLSLFENINKIPNKNISEHDIQLPKIKYIYNTTYYHTVMGETQLDKNKYGVDRHCGDTIEYVNIITSVTLNDEKIRDTTVTPHIPYRYKPKNEFK